MRTVKRAGATLVALLMTVVGLQVADAAPNNNEIGFRYFVGKGLTPAQSAGLIGNFMHESGDPIEPSRKQYGGGPGRGIAQWEGSRWVDLNRYANQRGLPWYNLNLQLDFVWKELTSTEGRALRELRATNTPERAAWAVRVYYERPSVHADAQRQAHARRVFNLYAGTNPRPGPVNPPPGPSDRPSVVGGPVNLRSGTSTSSTLLLTIPEGAVLDIQCQAPGETVRGYYTSNWWARVTYGGRTGWASRSYIRVPMGVNVPTCGAPAPGPAPAPAPAGTPGRVVDGPVNLRSGTNTWSATLASIPNGTVVNIQCQARGQAINGRYNSDWWARVTYNGQTGYASRAYIQVTSGSVPVC